MFGRVDDITPAQHAALSSVLCASRVPGTFAVKCKSLPIMRLNSPVATRGDFSEALS